MILSETARATARAAAAVAASRSALIFPHASQISQVLWQPLCVRIGATCFFPAQRIVGRFIGILIRELRIELSQPGGAARNAAVAALRAASSAAGERAG